MNIGLGVFQSADTKWYVALTVVDGATNYQVTITNEENYEHDIDELLAGLRAIKSDMRRAISGLEIVKEVPNGFRSDSAQGRQQHVPRGKG